MIISSPEPEPYPVDEYDFTFTNGLLMTFTVAKDLGDFVDFDTAPLAVKFHFAEKPSQTDPDQKISPEDITVMMNHVITVAHRIRQVIPQTRAAKDLFKQTLHELGRTVQ